MAGRHRSGNGLGSDVRRVLVWATVVMAVGLFIGLGLAGAF